MLTIPSQLAAACLKTPRCAAWLARLPEMLADGTRAVLKLGMPHMEADHEIAGHAAGAMAGH